MYMLIEWGKVVVIVSYGGMYIHHIILLHIINLCSDTKLRIDVIYLDTDILAIYIDQISLRDLRIDVFNSILI